MSDQTNRKEIVAWVDLIRVLAIYLVVVVHVSGQLTDAWGKIPMSQWLIADLYGGISRISVPLFFMISGYLLLPRSESLGVFYSKRILKILIPLVAWSLMYLGWYCGNHPGICTPGVIGGLLLPPGVYYHLWFLYALLSVYLVLPVLRLIIRPAADKKILWYLIFLWLIFQPVLTIIQKFGKVDINFSPTLTGGYVCFFIVGYLLGEIELSRPKLILSALTWGTGTLITVIGTYLLSRDAGQFEGFFYDYLSLGVILASGSAFLLLRWLSERQSFTSPQASVILRELATAAFGIYLVHVLVKEVLDSWIPFLQINASMGNALWSIPLTSTIIFVISFFIVRVLQKIPVLQKIVP